MFHVEHFGNVNGKEAGNGWVNFRSQPAREKMPQFHKGFCAPSASVVLNSVFSPQSRGECREAGSGPTREVCFPELFSDRLPKAHRSAAPPTG